MVRFFGARVLLLLWAAVLGTHTDMEKWPGIAISFLHPFLWFLFPLRGSIKVLGFFPTKNPFCRVETTPEAWTHLFSPSLTCL